MTPVAKTLLRVLVAEQIVRVRKGETNIQLQPAAAVARAKIEMSPEATKKAADELVALKLAEWTDESTLRMLPSALQMTL